MSPRKMTYTVFGRWDRDAPIAAEAAQRVEASLPAGMQPQVVVTADAPTVIRVHLHLEAANDREAGARARTALRVVQEIVTPTGQVFIGILGGRPVK